MAPPDALDASPHPQPTAARDLAISAPGVGDPGVHPLGVLLDLLPYPARLSTRTGECLHVNQAWLASTGRSADQMVGIGWLSVVHPDDRRAALASFDQGRDAPASSFVRSFRLRLHHGAYSVVRERDISTRESGEAILSIGSVSEALLDYEELQSWGHELRGTLNTIVGWTELVHSGQLTAEEAGNGMQAIRRAARQHAETIGNLLESVRLREDLVADEASAAPFGDVLARAIKALPPEIERSRIKVDLPEGDVLIAIDGYRAQRAIAQILQTLAHASPSIVLLVRVHADPEFIHLRIDEDSSSGAEERMIEELPAGAHRRYLTRLAYARSLICGSGGRIEIGRVGEVLVLRAALPRAAAPAISAADLPTLHGLRVLLVDDDADARMIGSQMLESFGALVITASSAREARDILGQEPSVDVLVSDIAMPDEDGYELLRAVRRMPDRRGTIPAVALTSFSGVSTERQTRLVGFQRCLFKPTEAKILATAIHEVWRNSRS